MKLLFDSFTNLTGKKLKLIIVSMLLFLSATTQSLQHFSANQHSLYYRQKKIPVLIIDGFSNHDWKQTTAVIKWILEQTGRFTVDVSTIPSDSVQRMSWRLDASKYPVVIQNTNNINSPALRWPPAAEQDLENYVKGGGGLYILHSANNAFPHWKEYDKMIGLGWRSGTVGHSVEIDPIKKIVFVNDTSTKGTGHGSRFDAAIHIINRHPINKDYPEIWKTANTEVYYSPRGPAENLTVLSYAYDSSSTHRWWPVEWVVGYGKGRVYNSSMGHLWKGEVYPPAYRCVGFQTTVIRVTEWLATGKVSYPVPKDFPTENSVSLKEPNEFLQGMQ